MRSEQHRVGHPTASSKIGQAAIIPEIQQADFLLRVAILLRGRRLRALRFDISCKTCTFIG